MSSLGEGSRLKLRLFLESIEVPVIEATVTAREGAPASAQIEILPTHRIREILPRTMVHLFYLDDSPQDPNAPGDFAYCLLFAGEVFSFSFSKSGQGSRSMVLSCLDFSAYWDAAYLFQLRYANDPNVLAGNTQVFLTAGTSTPLSDIAGQELETLIADMASRRTSGPYGPLAQEVNSSLGGLLGILELVGGVDNLSSGLNGWFTVSERRVRLLSQLATDTGDTAAQLYDASVFTGFLKNQLAQYGDVISFRDVLNMVLQYVYYAVVPNPVAPYFPGSRAPLTTAPKYQTASYSAQAIYLPLEEGVSTSVLQWLSPLYAGNPGKKAAAQTIETVFTSKGMPPEIIAAAIVNAVAESGLNPGSVNDGGPNHSEGFRSDGTPAKSIGLFQINDSARAWGANAGSEKDRMDATFNSTKILTDAGVPQVKALYDAGERDVAELTRQWCLLVERPGNKEVVAQSRALLSATVFSKAVTEAPVTPVASATATGLPNDPPQGRVVAATRERLLTQFFRPDVWFVAPPLCNIIFPEEYREFSYNQDLQRAVTRLQFNTSMSLIDDGSAYSFLQESYFAPVFPETDTQSSLTVGGIGSAAHPVIYDHEIFSGIVPRIERMSDLAFFTSKAKKEAAASGADIKAYASAAAAFNFLRYRYAAREATVSGEFMPRLICGYPAVVVGNTHVVPNAGIVSAIAKDAYDTSTQAPDPEPTHTLGLVTSVTHRVSQEGGSTSITLAYARPHRLEQTEAFIQRMALLTQFTETSTTVNLGGTIDPTWGQVISWLDQLLTATGPVTTLDVTRLQGAPPGPTGRPISRVDLIDPTETEVAGVKHPFLSAVIVEVTDGGNIPLEDAIRPAWISSEYANENIGAKIYQKLLGCAAITDVLDAASLAAIDPRAISPTVSAAVTKIVDDYSRLTQGGTVSGTPYIREATRRSHARLPEVLGENGFHAFACGPFANLEGLNLSEPLGPKPEQVPGDNAEKVPVSPRLDPRKARFDVIAAYAAELRAFRGLRG